MHQSQSVPHLQISGAGSSRNEKVKPDKKQRSAMQGLAGMDVLQLILQQVFERASLDGLLLNLSTCSSRSTGRWRSTQVQALRHPGR
mmetsp:Transcript_55292/g.129734  ORF Transcript_55292/g.129734 Transcript_55292/m.129734 type:complete len:87 (-) Transcript_55292:447-707(-)